MSVVFSVIVPVYNTEKYIDECVASITAQDYPDYEVILVDDGSKDRSPEICDELSRQDPERIRVIHKSNAGQLAARVSGIAQARGKYIVNVDADDMLKKDALSSLHRIFTEQSVDMVMYTLSSIDDNGVILNSSKAFFSRGRVEKDEFLRQMIGTGRLNSVVIKSFVRKPYQFDCSHRLTHGADFYMSLMILNDIGSVWYEPTPLYLYRTNPASATNCKDIHAYRDYLYTAEYTVNYIREHNLGEELIDDYLKHFTIPIRVALTNICIGKTDNRHEILTELRHDPIITRCYSYVRFSRRGDRISLRLFYNERYGALTWYEHIYNRLESYALSVKRAFTRHRHHVGIH